MSDLTYKRKFDGHCINVYSMKFQSATLLYLPISYY